MRLELRDGPSLPSRIKGRPALMRRMRSLLVAVHRFGRGRARSRDEQQWAATVIDGLTVLLGTGSGTTSEPLEPPRKPAGPCPE